MATKKAGKTSTKFDVIDKETGEKKELYLGEKKISFDRRYCVLFQEPLFMMAKKRKLAASELYILLYLMAESDYENRLWGVNSKMIQSALGLTQPQVSKGLGSLVDIMILEKDEHGRLSISPDVFWRGRAGRYKQVMKEREEAAKAARDKADKEAERACVPLSA